MSAYTRPFFISDTGRAEDSTLLERIPLNDSARGVQSERWLQGALLRYPESLPVKEIDPHIGPLIPVCMEIEAGAGSVDILYVTPSGQVVLEWAAGATADAVHTDRWIVAFNAEFVFSRDLEWHFGRSPKFMAQLFERNGFRAVARPDINGCRKVLRRRATVAVLLGESSRLDATWGTGDQQ